MTTIMTVASGKGGVGKSVSVTNLGLALAERGRRVLLADLDVGGSNLSTLFGVFEEGPDLGDFFPIPLGVSTKWRGPSGAIFL